MPQETEPTSSPDHGVARQSVDQARRAIRVLVWGSLAVSLVSIVLMQLDHDELAIAAGSLFSVTFPALVLSLTALLYDKRERPRPAFGLGALGYLAVVGLGAVMLTDTVMGIVGVALCLLVGAAGILIEVRALLAVWQRR